MAKARARSVSRDATRRPSAKTGRARRRGRALVVAAIAVAAGALLLTLTHGDGSRSGSGAFVGRDLHSLVAMDDGRVYVGGHDGVTLTTDGGRNWTQIVTLAHADAMGWGRQGDALFVSGHPGLNRSDDNGATFRHTNEGLPDTDMHASGAGATTLYGAGPRLGVVASIDGARTWRQRAGNVGQAFFGRILVDPADEAHLFAADVQGGPTESNDGGRSWHPLGGQPASWISSPDGAGRTLLASGAGVAARSTDGGRTWQPLHLPADAELVEAAPGDGQRLYAAGRTGSDARLWTSTDRGTTWTPG